MMSSSAKRLICAFVAILFVPLGTLTAYIAFIQINDNFDTVLADQVYRSAQPSVAQLQSYAKAYDIRSIINLRGSSPGSDWYDQEVQASQSLGIKHYDFRMSASQSLTLPEAKELIEIMRRAEKPVLIHCNWGADRTGLASALYLAALAHSGEEKAEEQISLKYGHFSIPALSQGFAMDETFEALEAWLGYKGS